MLHFMSKGSLQPILVPRLSREPTYFKHDHMAVYTIYSVLLLIKRSCYRLEYLLMMPLSQTDKMIRHLTLFSCRIPVS